MIDINIETRWVVVKNWVDDRLEVKKYEAKRQKARVKLLNSDTHWGFRTNIPFRDWDREARTEQEAKQKFIDRLRESQRAALTRAEGLGEQIRTAQEFFSK